MGWKNKLSTFKIKINKNIQVYKNVNLMQRKGIV